MFVLPPVAVLQPPKPVEGPTKRQGNKNRGIFVGGAVQRWENQNCMGRLNKEAAGWGAPQPTHLPFFVCGSFAWSLYPSPGSRKPVLWQFAEAENRTSRGGALPATEHGNKKRTDSQTPRKKKTNLKTNTPCSDVRYIIYILSASPDWKQAPFFTVVQRWDFSPSFFSSAVLVLRCLLQVKPPLSLTRPRWRRKRSCKRATSAWLKQMVHKGGKKIFFLYKTSVTHSSCERWYCLISAWFINVILLRESEGEK